MTMPFTYVDATKLMGSWPLVPTFGPTGTPTTLPGTLRTKARILGIVRETNAGFDVSSRSFDITVDSNSPVTVSFGPTVSTLDQVITQVNSDVGYTVAYRDNGFLLLESPTDGEGSYLKVSVDPASSPTDVLHNLGLFAGSESRAGEVAAPGHVEPERQVILPQQLSFAEGESFMAGAINRMAFQLAVNTDQQYGFIARKRQAKDDE